MKLIIGDIEFKTKKNAEEYCKNLLKKSDDDLSKDERKFIYALLINHPEWDRKSANIKKDKYKYVGISETFGTKGFCIFNKDNNIETISYHKCLGDKVSPKIIASEAFRYAIREQIRDYIKNNDMLKCYNCKKYVNRHNYEIDHIVMFDKLMNDFIKMKNINFDAIELKKIGCLHNFVDVDFENEWKFYHKKNASLQMLCKECHNEKSANECKRI